MFHLLVDTCVWLDLAKDPAQQPLLSALEDLIKANQVTLILPQPVLDEFARNRDRIITDSNRGLSGVIRRARATVEKFGDPKEKRRVVAQLDDLDHKLPQIGDTAARSVSRIESLFAAFDAIPVTTELLARAAQRAVDRRAPFHRDKNSINDAILVEVYRDFVRSPAAKGTRCAFVSHNIKDFSLPNGNDKLPHPDLDDLFSRVKSLYAITLSDVIKRIAPDILDDAEFEENYHQDPRRLNQIIEAIDELFDKVWYNRHLSLRYGVEDGDITIVDGPYDYRDQSKVERKIWEGARTAAKRVERKRGVKNLGPWTDFEWGMINGKLSALRWVLGDEWDMLDT